MSLAALAARARAAFESAYGSRPAQLVQAPGRVNLIGEHTDYNDGFVLPCAIDRATVVAVSPRRDALVRAIAADAQGELDSFRIDAPIGHRSDAPWADYVRGMLQQLLLGGHLRHGLDLAIAGDVPQGAGLSSSASLTVAIGQACISAAPGAELDRRALALLAQRAENQFVGTQCGIMDQLISASGEAGTALLIDCRSLATRAVPLPPGVAVLIAHSMLSRGLVESAYNERRAACEAAARHFGVPALRDVSHATLRDGAAGLDATQARRARHVVTENARTLVAADALAAGDLAQMGRLMAASHASMRDDFEITLPAIDRLVEIIGSAIGDDGGARMTGGGFGGCVVALVREARVPVVRDAIARAYRSPSGEAATVYECHASAGAGAL